MMSPTEKSSNQEFGPVRPAGRRAGKSGRKTSASSTQGKAGIVADGGRGVVGGRSPRPATMIFLSYCKTT